MRPTIVYKFPSGTLQQIHRKAVNKFACSKVCDPVKLQSMRKDYRAGRKLTHWYIVEFRLEFPFLSWGIIFNEYVR
jgi:hypothetical protein